VAARVVELHRRGEIAPLVRDADDRAAVASDINTRMPGADARARRFDIAKGRGAPALRDLPGAVHPGQRDLSADRGRPEDAIAGRGCSRHQASADRARVWGMMARAVLAPRCTPWPSSCPAEVVLNRSRAPPARTMKPSGT